MTSKAPQVGASIELPHHRTKAPSWIDRDPGSSIDSLLGVSYIGNMKHLERAREWMEFGDAVRRLREARASSEQGFSLRQVAARCDITPAYLSRIERGEVAPPGEETLIKLAKEIGEDPDVLLAMAGKISADLRAVILARPKLFAELIRSIKDAPDNSLLRVVREVRDGNW